ncbi:MAG: LytTR family DNA-binding domain-containing protein [Ginsengibacter sp.]
MIKAIAIDDEPLALKVLEEHAAKINFINLEKTFSDPLAGFDYVKREAISVIFLDIKMHDISGVELAELMPAHVRIIFTTGYAEYAITGFELNAVDYLLKPISFSRFLKACYKLKNQIDLKQNEQVLLLKEGNQIARVKTSEIYYIEAAGNYLKLFTSNGMIFHRQTIKEFIESLPDTFFIRTHKSYIVNVEHISRIEVTHLTLDNQKIPLSPNYKTEVWRKLGIQ